MKVRVITSADGTIKAFRKLAADHDPRQHGDIFPLKGDSSHELEVPEEHGPLFDKRPTDVFRHLRVRMQDGIPKFAKSTIE